MRNKIDVNQIKISVEAHTGMGKTTTVMEIARLFKNIGFEVEINDGDSEIERDGWMLIQHHPKQLKRLDELKKKAKIVINSVYPKKMDWS